MHTPVEPRDGLESLTEALQETAAMVRDPDRGAVDAEEEAAGYAYATELTRLALDLYGDADGGDPRFVPFSSPLGYHAGDLAIPRVQGGANPDGLYDFAVLDPSRRYRISGIRGNDCYLSFSFSGGESGGWPSRTVATLNDREMHVGADGAFEVVVSPDRTPGNWVRMEPDVCSVIVRQYFDVLPEQRRPATLRIEVLDDDPEPTPAPLATVVGPRLAAAAAFIRSTNDHFPLPAGLTENVFTEPLGYSGEAGALGTTDNVYCMGRWMLEPGEAMVIETTPAACGYWSVQLWNHWGQSLAPAVDAESYPRQILNRARAVPEDDGSVRVVVSEHDPGHPNWLSTFGWRRGAMIFRFLYPEAKPDRPACRVTAAPKGG